MACDQLLAKIEDLKNKVDEQKSIHQSLISQLNYYMSIASENLEKFLGPVLIMYIPIEHLPDMTDKDPAERAKKWFDYLLRAINYYFEHDGSPFTITFHSLLKTFPTPPYHLQMLLDNEFDTSPQSILGSLFMAIKQGKILRMIITTESNSVHQFVFNIQDSVLKIVYTVDGEIKRQQESVMEGLAMFVGATFIYEADVDQVEILIGGSSLSWPIAMKRENILNLKIASDDPEPDDAKYIMYFDYRVPSSYSKLFERYIAAQNF